MKADETYFRTEIQSIPVHNLEEIMKKEVVNLMYDFGQKVQEDDTNELKYLIRHTVENLRQYYPKWKLSYVGECFRKGKLDEYDKGQRINMKRLEYWFKCYNSFLLANSKKETKEEFLTDNDVQRFALNGEKYADLLLFRIGHKPNYDGEQWTLAKIAETSDYKRWKEMGYRKHVNISSGINKLHKSKA